MVAMAGSGEISNCDGSVPQGEKKGMAGPGCFGSPHLLDQ
jgi:hypothetical protein